ncbi:GspE/PulE family protein [Proteiniclasticum ruminis]|uniref:Type IV pilus assembly protein PilB n=1 Tax=Proteiniclasticum ruminis TaxID=398199 RepID=A0A1G8KKU5_9CLOT|nr:GspE/PulE family protein [Proteiniclasticum ruminis]SDI44018.1 type IV pilus assembly protein PilB [Proteiniclasticum ruminis]
MATKRKLGDLLIDLGLISENNLNAVLEKQKITKKKLGEILIEEKYLTEREFFEVLEFQLGVPYVDLDRFSIESDAPKLITANLAKRHTVIPVSIVDETLTLAMNDPLDLLAIDDVKLATKLEVKPVIAGKHAILDAIDFFYEKEDAEKAIEEFRKEFDEGELEGMDEEMLNDINNAPVVRLINSIISQAVKLRASDIHIEPFEKKLKVRCRVDGDLIEVMRPSKAAHAAIVTRIKIMGKMDISERRKPQDGRMEKAIDGRVVDMRISVLPTVFGEKVVIRILDRTSFMMTKEELGFTENNLTLFNQVMRNPNGIILITGPTGSGKSTTLYTVLAEMNQPDKNIVTVEDPVEYSLDGINQVQVNPKADLTFATGLRSILRQDPDIIMVGEIRDPETVNIAIRAAITGHLVLSTIHTNDTASTITRLVNMGIDPYLISSSVVGIVAQRLVKRICTHCKISYEIDDKNALLVGIPEKTQVYRGEGCTKCNGTGTSGRTAVHEVMVVDREIRNMINEGHSIDEIKDKAISSGMHTLKDACRELLLKGIITMDEMLKITYSTEA